MKYFSIRICYFYMLKLSAAIAAEKCRKNGEYLLLSFFIPIIKTKNSNFLGNFNFQYLSFNVQKKSGFYDNYKCSEQHDIKFWRPQEDRRLYSGVDYVMNSKLFRLLPVCQLLCIQQLYLLSPHFNYIDYIVIKKIQKLT